MPRLLAAYRALPASFLEIATMGHGDGPIVRYPAHQSPRLFHTLRMGEGRTGARRRISGGNVLQNTQKHQVFSNGGEAGRISGISDAVRPDPGKFFCAQVARETSLQWIDLAEINELTPVRLRIGNHRIRLDEPNEVGLAH